MKIKSIVALTTLSSFLAFSGFALAADKKSEPKMDGDCHGQMHEGRDRGMRDRDGEGRGGFDRGMGEHREHMIKALDLTDAQKKTLEEQKSKQKTAMDALVDKQKAAREALRKAAESNADDATLNKAANEVAAAIAQAEVARIKAHRQFLQTLTAEQKQKLADMEKNRRPAAE